MVFQDYALWPHLSARDNVASTRSTSTRARGSPASSPTSRRPGARPSACAWTRPGVTSSPRTRKTSNPWGRTKRRTRGWDYLTREAGHRESWNTSACPTISRMTVTLLTSQSAPTTTDADALVIGVFQGTDGPVPTPGTDDIDLMAALTALGATGKLEEITKIHTAGRLAAPVVVAVGLGPEPERPRPGSRRAAGLPGKAAPLGRRRGARADIRPGQARSHRPPRRAARRGRGGCARHTAGRLCLPQIPDGRQRGR